MKYAIITNEKRTTLLERVVVRNEPIKVVAEELKIKFPSAKSIIRTYKKTGRVFNKKKTRKNRSSSAQSIQVKEQPRENDEVKKEYRTEEQVVAKQQKLQNCMEVHRNLLPFQNLLEQPLISYGSPYYAMFSPYMAPQYMQYPSVPFNANCFQK